MKNKLKENNESRALISKSNLLGCIKNTVTNGWPIMLIIFIIYLFTGPIYMYVAFKDEYKRYDRNITQYEKIYDMACHLQESGQDDITEKQYNNLYGDSKFSISYYEVSEYLNQKDMHAYHENAIERLKDNLRSQVEDMYGSIGMMIVCVVGFCIVFFAVQNNFAFDKGKKNTDFYGALPVKRYEYYISAVICSFIFAVVPLMISGILTVPVLIASEATKVIKASVLWGYAGKYILSAAIYFYDFLAVAVIANVIGNSVPVSMLIYGILNFYPVAFFGIGSLVSEIASGSFGKYISRIVGFDRLIIYSSPALRMGFTVGDELFGLGIVPMHLTFFVISTAVLVGGYFIFAVRKAENSVLPCSFHPVRYVIQYMSMIITSLLISVVFEAMSDTGIIGVCVLSTISCFLSFICFNALFEGNIRLLLKNMRHGFILFGSVIFLTVFVFGDIFYIFKIPEPNENNITSVTFTFNDDNISGMVNGLYPTSITVDRSSPKEARKLAIDIINERAGKTGEYEHVKLEDKLYSPEPMFETAYGSLGIVMEVEKIGIDYSKPYTPSVHINVRYGLFEKSFSVSSKEYSPEPFIELAKLANVTTIFESIVSDEFSGVVSASDIYESALYRLQEVSYNLMLGEKKLLTEEQMVSFKEALKKDLSTAKTEDYESPSRYVLILRAPNNKFSYTGSGGVSIPESFTNTIDLLRKYGCLTDMEENLNKLSMYVIGVDEYDTKDERYEPYWDIINKKDVKEDRFTDLDDEAIAKLISENIFVPYDVCHNSLLNVAPEKYYKLYVMGFDEQAIITFDLCSE